MEKLTNFFIYFIIYSFFGWFYETSLTLITQHKFVKKGCFNGPLCPIYGTGAVCMVILLEHYDNPILIFLGGGFTACALEYLTSYFIEKWFHVRLWDYTKRRFNLNGRCCLLGFIVFGLFAAILLELVHPYIVTCLNLMPKTIRYVIATLLLVDLVIDASLTIHNIAKLQSKIDEAAAIRKQYLENAEEKLQSLHQRNTDFFERLNYQQRNMLRSFPNLRLNKNNELLTELKRVVHKDQD